MLLSEGNGLALDVVPRSGVLVPWGVTEVRVKAYNNMAGTYNDELQAAVLGAPPAALHVKMVVQGCPLSLRRECVGLDCRGAGLPRLQFGEVCAGDGPHSKTITVKNDGPVDALLSWKVGREGRGTRPAAATTAAAASPSEAQ